MPRSRALGLVWSAAPGWTAALLVLLLFQAFLPVITVLLTREIVNSVTTALRANAPPHAFQTTFILVILIALTQ